MKSKKAQGLPMNAIVIAAIVLIVLVVLIMIFTGSMGKWLEDLKIAREAKNCTTGYKGNWKAECDQGEIPVYNVGDADTNPGKTCCVKST